MDSSELRRRPRYRHLTYWDICRPSHLLLVPHLSLHTTHLSIVWQKMESGQADGMEGKKCSLEDVVGWEYQSLGLSVCRRVSPSLCLSLPVPFSFSAQKELLSNTLALRFAEEVDSYLVRHSIDHETSQALRALSADIQADIIKSDLSNCRNASEIFLAQSELCGACT